MNPAVKDMYGNKLRPKYRVAEADDVRLGTVIALYPPFRLSVRWDDGEEEVLRGVKVRHMSKQAPR